MSILLAIWKFLPMGKDTRLTLMRIMQDQFLVATTGIIFNERDEILLFQHTYRQIPWNLPAGYLKAKEHPREGLAREIEEESGLIVSIEERVKMRTDRHTARLDVCYSGTYIGGVFQASDEVSKYGFFTLATLPLIPKDQLLLIQLAMKKRQRFNATASVSRLAQ